MDSAVHDSLIVTELERFVPTVRAVRRFSDVNLNEWDVVITRTWPVSVQHEPETDTWGAPIPGSIRYTWNSTFPENLCVISIISGTRSSVDVVDLFPPNGEGKNLPPAAIVVDGPVTGDQLRAAQGLPDHLAALVSTVLVPAAKAQDTYTSIDPRTLVGAPDDLPDGAEAFLASFRPFLYGPDDVAIAGSYERSSTASVWLLPDYCSHLPAWTRAALQEWSELYPKRFPKIPHWDSDPSWQTAQEREIDEQRRSAEAKIRSQIDAWSAEDDRLAAELDAAATAAAAYERALLTKDGSDLEAAVARAFGDLGFRVANMDEQWDDGNRREDLRLYLDEDPNWVAVVEIKGFTKGAQETKLHGMGRWVERFVLDEHRSPSARWFVTNHNRRQHPDERPAAFKADVVDAFRESGGLIIDTRALFAAVRHVQEDPASQSDVRTALVNALGLMNHFEVPKSVGDES